MYRFISRRWGHGLIAGAGLALVALLGAILPSVTTTRGAPLATAVVVSATGANAAAIQPTVDAFRTALGTLNPNVAGSVGSGRREINWDGVPEGSSAPNNLPLQIFNITSPRGVVFSTPGTGFQVSATAGNSTATPIEFGNLNPSYPTIFQTFSSPKLFTPLGSNVTDVAFFVPGSYTPATVSGFGAVFTDVDTANVTSIAYFDFNGTSLGTFFVPATAGSETLSFLGVTFNAGERVGRVRITTGNAAVGPNDAPPGTDIVVMDDFIYGEPVACIQADVNCDGIVDVRDYGIWRQHFGQTPP
jgi:hypothetical protein